jgi:biotin transport system substrate-specific component
LNKELTASIHPAALSTASATLLRKAAIVLAGSAFVAICAHIALPLYFTPVPLTLQNFAVLALGLLLPPRLAFDTLFAYLLEGAIGLPVFAPTLPAVSGLAHLLGPTGGYLLVYPLATALISVLWRSSSRGFVAAAISAAAGDLTILICGVLWLAVFTHASLRPVLALGLYPFLSGDALKIAAAAALAVGVQRLRRRNASPHLSLHQS